MQKKNFFSKTEKNGQNETKLMIFLTPVPKILDLKSMYSFYTSKKRLIFKKKIFKISFRFDDFFHFFFQKKIKKKKFQILKKLKFQKNSKLKKNAKTKRNRWFF